MKSIVRKGLQVKTGNKKTNRIFIISLSLALIAIVVSTSSTSSLQFLRPAMAASLSSVTVIPASNTINERETYDIFFKTATSGTIKTIEMTFPVGFDIHVATKLIERSGIGSGSLSVSGQKLSYTVSSPVSVPSGTTIRLEIGRILSTVAGSSHTVSIKTLNTSGGTIDGSTNSGTFIIKDITANDVSPNLMKSKTLFDDTAGHSHGWDPDGSVPDFTITDSDINPGSRVIVNLESPSTASCNVGDIGGPGINSGFFRVDCDSVNVPPNNANLHYVIVNGLTDQEITTASTSSASSTLTSQYEPFRAHDQIASDFP